VRDVMRLAQKARQSLAYDRMPLSVLPVPARWCIHESQETQVWMDRVTEAAKEFYEDWLPRTIQARDVVERIKVPQSDFFGWREASGCGTGTSDPQGMGFVYDKVAAFFASDFTGLSALIGEQAVREAKSNETNEVRPSIKSPESTGYAYDIFVSYDRLLSEVVLEFVEALRLELGVLRAEQPRIFVDLAEIPRGGLPGTTSCDPDTIEGAGRILHAALHQQVH
jgi:hypothetical protein